MKFSIITITYNSEKTLEETIRSVVNQNYPELEYIIIDGKSTDNTISIIKKYEDKARAIYNDYDLKWQEKNKKLEKLLDKFIKEVMQNDIKK